MPENHLSNVRKHARLTLRARGTYLCLQNRHRLLSLRICRGKNILMAGRHETSDRRYGQVLLQVSRGGFPSGVASSCKATTLGSQASQVIVQYPRKTHLPFPSAVGFILTSITMNPVGRILPGIAVISLEPSPPAAAAPGLAKVASPGDREFDGR